MNTQDKENIKKLRAVHTAEMNSYGDQVREYVAEYGAKPCDYLLHRQRIGDYHRGAVNVLITLEKMS